MNSLFKNWRLYFSVGACSLGFYFVAQAIVGLQNKDAVLVKTVTSVPAAPTNLTIK